MSNEIYFGCKYERNAEGKIIDIKRKILDNGQCFGFNYYIITFGSHPCSYIEIPKENKLYRVRYMDKNFVDLKVHGGITFSEDHLLGVDETGLNWYIGWDYGHHNDYQLFSKVKGKQLELQGHKWTLEELKQEVFDVCKQLTDIM